MGKQEKQMMDGRVRFALRLVAFGGMALMLIGCQSIREAAGVTKEPPDEFAVVTKAPLVIPPEFNLRPPKPGASPTNQVDPTAAAQIAMTNSDPNAIAAAMPKNYSDEERFLLAKTGGAAAEHTIRQQIEAENKKMEPSDQSFTDKVLFGASSDDKPVDADAEAKRIADAKAQGKTAATPPAANGKPASEKKPDETPQIKKEDSGWLDGVFGGIF
jgi:hypothetical protein